MRFRAFFFRHRAVLVLGSCVLVALIAGGLQLLVYRFLHRLDCGAPGSSHHPLCHPGQVNLLLNGRILTMGTPEEVEALAVREGEIIAVGTAEDLKQRYPEATKVDLNGYLALPGFHNANVNLLLGGLGVDGSGVDGVSDPEACLESLSSYAKGRPGVSWIVGQGWSESWAVDGVLDRHALDRVSSGHPVFLWRRDHQAALANSLALKLLDIDASFSDPIGGKIDRDEKGVPLGVLEGSAATTAYDRIVTLLPDEVIKRALLQAQQVLLSMGITRVGDRQPSTPNLLAKLGDLYERGLWRLRVCAVMPPDGASRRRYALYRSPDEDTLDSDGVFVSSHSSEAEAVGVAEGVAAELIRGPSPSLNLPPDSSLLTAFGTDWPFDARPPLFHLEAAMGLPDRRSVGSPNKASSDFPDEGSEYSPGVEPVEREQQRSRGERLRRLLAAYTTAHARAIGRESREGVLEVGRLADLVVLDRDILAIEEADIGAVQVVRTIIGGETVWSREDGWRWYPSDTPLGETPAWYKVLARQHFPALVLIVSMVMSPLVILLLWAWEKRPQRMERAGIKAKNRSISRYDR